MTSEIEVWIDLMSCPFCGQTPEVEPWGGGGPDRVIIYCPTGQMDGDPVCASPQVVGENPLQAATFWNTRPVQRRSKVKVPSEVQPF